MERRDDQRTAFAKACAYLSYNRAAQWTAHAAGVGSCLVYVALLMVLWLFADLMVSRGRLPTYHDVPPAAQNRFLNEWKNLPGGDLTSPVSSAAATIAGQMAEPSGQGPLDGRRRGRGRPHRTERTHGPAPAGRLRRGGKYPPRQPGAVAGHGPGRPRRALARPPGVGPSRQRQRPRLVAQRDAAAEPLSRRRSRPAQPRGALAPQQRVDRVGRRLGRCAGTRGCGTSPPTRRPTFRCT